MKNSPIVLLALVLAAVPATSVSQEPATRLEDLIVTVHRIPVPIKATSASVTVLDGRSLEEAGYVSVLDALRAVPGLAVTQSGSFGSIASIFLRGGESDYVGVLIDGVQVNEPGGAFDFAHLTVQQIERIEIVRGPASSMYGSDAVSGVIQIFTRTGDGSPTGSVTLMGGTYDSWRGSAQIEGGADAVSYGFALSGLRSDGTLSLNNEYENLTFSGRVELAPDEQTDVRLSAQYTDHTFHFPTDGTGAVVDENAFAFGDDLTLSLDARRRLAEAVELAVLIAARDSEGGTDDSRDGPADSLGFFGFQSLDDLQRVSADLRTNLDLGQAGRASAGVEFEEQSLRSFNESQSEFGPSSGRSDENRSNRAYYAGWLGQWGDWAANGSLRVEDNQTFGSLVTYSVGTTYYVDRTHTRLRGLLGRGIKEPTLFENFATGFARGNPDLDPEESFSWEVGIEQYLLAERVRLSATYFDQSFEQLIQFTFAPVMPDGPNFFNVAAADVRGVEAEVGGAAGPFDLSASYTFLDSKVVDAGFDEGEDATFVVGEPLLRRPRHQFTVQAIGRVRQRGTAGVAVRWTGDRIDRDFSAFPAPRVTLPVYTVVDLHGNLDLTGAGAPLGVSVLARVENLFDESYAEVHGFPARGRTIWLGARFSPGGGE